jgi:hypothetical protein
MTLCQRQENADNSPQGEHNDEKGLGVWLDSSTGRPSFFHPFANLKDKLMLRPLHRNENKAMFQTLRRSL